MTQRTQKIDELLRQEIGQALEHEVTDPGLGFVTVTRVETAQDLSHARVWVSVIGSEEERKASLAALRRAMPFIRHSLGAKIRIRRIPELDVRLDESAERGTRVLHVLDELEAGRLPGDAGGGESLPTPVNRLPRVGDSELVEGSAVLPPIPPSPFRGKHEARPRREGGGHGAAGGSGRSAAPGSSRGTSHTRSSGGRGRPGKGA